MKEFLDNGHVIKIPFVMPNNLHSPRNDLKIRSFAFFFFTLAAFILFTQHNDFPFYYHTDEPSKAIQVLTGQRNFHHPLMLLRSTELLVGIAHIPSNPQAVVEAGRSLSGFFAALAVGTLMLLGWNLGGAFAGILCGVLLLSHPVLFELAHYMKEDCALLAGVAATFYSINCYERKNRSFCFMYRFICRSCRFRKIHRLGSYAHSFVSDPMDSTRVCTMDSCPCISFRRSAYLQRH
jgi:hypothetical protein